MPDKSGKHAPFGTPSPHHLACGSALGGSTKRTKLGPQRLQAEAGPRVLEAPRLRKKRASFKLCKLLELPDPPADIGETQSAEGNRQNPGAKLAPDLAPPFAATGQLAEGAMCSDG